MKKLVLSLFALAVLAIAAVGFAMPPQDQDPDRPHLCFEERGWIKVIVPCN